LLVITRKINQSIIINDNIEVKLLSIRGNQVRVGLEAPKNIKIKPAELTTIGDNKNGK